MSVEPQAPRVPIDDLEWVATKRDFAAALTRLRERAGLTVRQVARASGLQSSTVGGYFSGRHLPPLAPPHVLPDLLRACGVTGAAEVEQWWSALRRVRRAPGPRPAGAPVPYRGLRAFQPEDADWFCGREQLTTDLVARCAQRYAAGDGLLVVVGPSGSGKSSLLRAGLVPAVRDGGVPGSRAWPVVLFTPGPDPRRRLREELAAAAAEGAPGLLVVVDQAEELFTAEVDESARAAFLADLHHLATGRVAGAGDLADPAADLADPARAADPADPAGAEADAVDPDLAAANSGPANSGPANPAALAGPARPALVVLGLRADFYGHALRHPVLASALQQAQVVVGPMTTDQLRCVIMEPARRAGVDVDDALVEVMLRDVVPAAPPGHQLGALPLLSHALLVTWELGQGRRLTLADYQESGGLRSAVARTAEGVYEQLGAARRRLARRLFLRLVRVAADGADTARRVRRAELTAGASPVESRACAEVLERFIAGRLVTADADTVQVSHEALLYAWPRLREWIDADRAGLLTRQRLVEDAEAWQREQRDPAALYRGSRLAATRDWIGAGRREVPPVVHEFLAAGTRRERRGVRRLYQVITALATLLALAAAAGMVAIEQRGRALAQEEIATSERDRALSRLVAGRADRLRGEDVALAAQLSLIAYQIAPTAEALAALLDSSAAHTATRLLGSTGVMQSVALSPDRRTLAAGTADRTVLLWDLSDPRHPIRREPALTRPADIVYSVAFSPDGRTLAAGSGDGLIYRWDLTDPARPVPLGPPLAGPADLVYSVAFSLDGRTLAAGSGDHLVHRWDVTDPRRPVRLGTPLPGAGSYIQSVAFSPDGELLAAGSDDSTVWLWDLRDREYPRPIAEPLAGPGGTVFTVAFSPDGRTLAAGSRDGSVYLWDLSGPAGPERLGDPLAGAAGWVQAVAFSPDGRTLAAGSAGEVRLWDWRAAQVTATLPHTGPVTSLTFGASAGTLVTAAADGTARLWRLPGPVLGGDGVPVNNLDFSPDGLRLAVASGGVRLWRVTGPAPLGPPITNPTGFSGAAVFTSDGDALVVSDRAGQLRTWDLGRPDRPVPRGPAIPGHDLRIEQMAASPDRTVLASAGDDERVRLWRVTGSGEPSLAAELDGFDAYVYSVKFSPSGDLLAAASVDYTVRIWDVRDPRQPVDLSGPLSSSEHYALSVAFHPSRPLLAVGSGDNNAYLWDITDPRRPVRVGPPLVGAGNYVYALAFTPDGNTLAAASTDQTLWLWDVTDPAAPRVRATLTAAGGPLYAVGFHPDLPLLAAGGGGGWVWLWSTDAEAVARSICATAGDPITAAEWRKYVPDAPYQPPC